MTGRWQIFLERMSAFAATDPSDAEIAGRGADLLRELIAVDDWLEPRAARSDPVHYQQHLLHCDERGRFSVVSFVWGPGQSTPIHDHTVWGLVGVLRGGEISQRYELSPDGGLVAVEPATILAPGDVDVLLPSEGDIHKVSNLFAERTSVSIHVYGADIGRVSRTAFTPDGVRKTFVSGYASRPEGTSP